MRRHVQEEKYYAQKHSKYNNFFHSCCELWSLASCGAGRAGLPDGGCGRCHAACPKWRVYQGNARLHISLVLNQNPLKMLTVIKMEKNQMRCPLRCLQSRFEDMHENPLFLAAHIFDHKNWPGFGGEEALMLYGKDEIKTIYCALQEWSWECQMQHGFDTQWMEWLEAPRNLKSSF